MNFEPRDRVRHHDGDYSDDNYDTILFIDRDDIWIQIDDCPNEAYRCAESDLERTPRTHEEIAAEYAEVLGSTDLDPCQNPCPSYDESGCNVCHASRYHAIILAAIEEAVVH